MSVKSRICVHQSTKCGFSKKAFRRQYFFVFPYVLLTCYHHLRAKLGMYIALCIFLNFWQVWVGSHGTVIADPSSDFAPHSRWGALEQCSLTLIGASLNSPESSALYQNSVLRKFCSSRQKFSCRQKFCKACRQKFSSSRKYLRRFFYYVFHI